MNKLIRIHSEIYHKQLCHYVKSQDHRVLNIDPDGLQRPMVYYTPGPLGITFVDVRYVVYNLPNMVRDAWLLDRRNSKDEGLGDYLILVG